MKFKSTASYLLITFFMAAIVISFAFTGFEGFNSSTGAVAKVGSQKVTLSEYQRAYNAEIQRFQGLFGGKSLTAAQIRQFRIKEGALNRLIDQKLVLELANKMNIGVSKEEIKEDIKKAEYFLTNKRFDVNKYKSLLSANGYTPSSFEKLTEDTVKLKKVASLFDSTYVSEDSVKASQMIKNSSATVNAVSFDKEKLVKFINISKSKIKDFTAKKENQNILKSLFNSMKNEFNKPARVNARHILIKEDPKNKGKALKKAKALRKKLTRSNFAKIAGKETEDPSGKGKKGGSLGWFTKGKMVPEFEKKAFSMKPGEISAPVKTNFGYHIIYVQKKDKAVTKTLEQVKDKVAKSHLQKTSRDELSKLQESIKNNLSVLLKTNNTKKLKAYSKKYDLKLASKASVNPIDSKAEQIALKESDVIDIVLNNNTSKVFVNDNASQITLYKALSVKSQDKIKTEVNKNLKVSVSSANRNLANTLQRNLIEYLKEGVKVVTYPNLL